MPRNLKDIIKEAIGKSLDAYNKKFGKQIHDRIDNIVAQAGTDNTEIVDARMDSSGKKHSTLNNRINNEFKMSKEHLQEVKGEYVTVEGSVPSTIPEIELHGNTIQNASNLADIKSSCIPNGDGTFKMSILSVGENLYNSTLKAGDIDNVTGLERSGVTNHAIPVDFVSVPSSSQIILSCTYVQQPKWVVMYEYDKDKKYLGYTEGLKLTTKPNTKYVKFKMENGLNVSIVNIKLQEGTVATTYTPYQETRCDIKLPCQLEKWDRLYFDKDENAWVVDKVNTKYFPNVSKLFNFTDLGTTVRVNHNASDALIQPSLEEGICNILPYDSNRKWEDDRESCYLLRSGIVTLKFNKSKISNLTIEGVRQYVKDIGLYIHYPATTPQKIVLPQSEQIKLNSFANKTHIYTISGDVDATVKATVSKSLASTVQANTNEINILSDKIADIQGLKESQDFEYELPNGQNYLVCKDTKNGVVKDLKIYGKSLVNLSNVKNGDFSFSPVPSKGNTIEFKKAIKGKFKILLDVKENTLDKLPKLSLKTSNGVTLFRPRLNMVSGRCETIVDTLNGDSYEEILSIRLYTDDTNVGNFVYDNLTIIDKFLELSPSYFEGIASVGNGNEIEVLSNGKNFFYGVLELGDWKYDGSNMNNAKGNYTNVCRNSVPVRIIPNTSFCINFSGNLYNIRLVFFDINGKFITTRNPSKNNCSFTSPQNAYYMCFNSQSIDATDTIINSNVMINIGDNFEKFEPFKQDKKTILFKDTDNTWKPVTELKGIDIYKCDTIEQHSDGKHYLHIRTKKEVLRGLPSELWESRTPLTNAVRFGMNLTDAKKEVLSNSIYTLSDTIPSTSFSFFYNIDNVEGLAFANDSTFLNIQILKSKLETSDVIGFKKWLQSNPITVIYQLAQEKVYEVNPLGLQSFENETMILFGSGVIAPHAEWTITSSLPNFVMNVDTRVKRMENDFYKYTTMMFKSMLNGNLDQVAYMLYPEDFNTSTPAVPLIPPNESTEVVK